MEMPAKKLKIQPGFNQTTAKLSCLLKYQASTHNNEEGTMVNTPYKITHILLMATLTGISGLASAHVISEEDHHAFEHKYSERCQKKAKAKTQDGTIDAATVAMCDCIALEESKRITIQEVKKYLREDKMPMSLIMKSSGATYNCSNKQFP